ncbi:hypothetical protein [Bradyrhizobium sp. 2S1]|uniref:hypothetical protein n=1 Tax=Bradyrhizobium sp. 2S1 TaxID=1404429 RepID=UPI001CD15A38|nr:hypothetical protein [Bradyrhizobium sp. 2S1]MCK7671275.1 hypothetical protein [Bradyrhizobium sp. 2S1]
MVIQSHRRLTSHIRLPPMVGATHQSNQETTGFAMNVAMDGQELTLFKSFVDLSTRYLEFGSGGSTWLACQTRKEWVISIDSSEEWLSNVGDATKGASTKPLLLHVDIGKLREWGHPADRERESSWPDYHELVWERPESKTADLYFIDGRFRVACFVQCVLHAAPGAFIAIHDFENRPHYHPVRTVAREIARANNMSIFQRPPRIDVDAAQALLQKYRLEPL